MLVRPALTVNRVELEEEERETLEGSWHFSFKALGILEVFLLLKAFEGYLNS